MGEMHEPEIVIIKEGPVVLGEPEFPFNARLPPPWSRKLVHVPTFGIGKYAAKLAIRVGLFNLRHENPPLNGTHQVPTVRMCSTMTISEVPQQHER